MIRSFLLAVLAMLVVALMVTVKVQEHRLYEERGKVAQLGLRAENLAAERDSTRELAAMNKNVARLLGDSVRSFEQRVVQVAQRNDALDRALGRERRARYQLDLSVGALDRTALTAAVADSTRAIRRAHWGIRQEPYTLAADVEMPEPPDSARLTVRVALDPIRAEARVSCSSPNEQGIRSASVVALTPPWATVRFDRVEQSSELCPSPALARPTHGHRLLAFAPLFVGVGRTIAPGGQGSWGIFVGTGIALGS